MTELHQADIAFQANLYNDPNPSRRWLHTVRREWVQQKLVQYTPAPGIRVIEIGVGAGIYTRQLAARGAKIYAVDINPDFLNAVRDLPDIMISCGDATRGVSLDSHDLALCSEVLEHVVPQDSLRLLHTLYHAVRPGGHVILTTPQRTSTMERFVRLLQYRPFLALARAIYGKVDELGHINVLSDRELMAQLQAVGFEVVECTKRALYLPVLAEVGGRPGQAIAAFLERPLRNSVLSGLLWTQAYVLRRPA